MGYTASQCPSWFTEMLLPSRCFVKGGKDPLVVDDECPLVDRLYKTPREHLSLEVMLSLSSSPL